MSFLYTESEIANERINAYHAEIQQQMAKLKDYMSIEHKTADGIDIVNMDDTRLWFRDNVAFIFVIGSIFNTEDQRCMRDVLSTFVNNRSSAFLMNHYRILLYTDELAKSAEHELCIGAGNYHILLTTLVYRDADITNAPTPDLSRVGFVEKYTSWDSIYKLLTHYINIYGLVTTPLVEEKQVKYKYDTLTHETDDTETYKPMPRSRDKSALERTRHPSLMTRIHEDKMVDSTRKDDFVGVVPRAPPTHMPKPPQFFTIHTDDGDKSIPIFPLQQRQRHGTRIPADSNALGVTPAPTLDSRYKHLETDTH